MQDQPHNPPAFPIPDQRDANGVGIAEGSPGMSLRDYIAIKVAPTFITAVEESTRGMSIDASQQTIYEGIAIECYSFADAMLAVREWGPKA